MSKKMGKIISVFQKRWEMSLGQDGDSGKGEKDLEIPKRKTL